MMLLVVLSTSVVNAGRRYLEVHRLSKRSRKDYVFLHTKVRVYPKIVHELKLVIYALTKDKDEYHLLRGELSFPDLKRGVYERTGILTESLLDTYGEIERYRVEIWHKDELIHARNNRRTKTKWWDTEKLKPHDVISIPNMNFRDFLRKLEGEEDD